MDLYKNDLIIKHLNKTKTRISFYLAEGQSPYYEIYDNDESIYRPEYVDLCVKRSYDLWKKCGFSNDLTVLFEDKYSSYHKGEKEFIESCLDSSKCSVYYFKWSDDGEKFNGTRYVWNTNKIDVKLLFEKIILSDIGEDTVLDCSVFIMDNKSKNIFFLYDDRGIDIFSNDENFISKIKS